MRGLNAPFGARCFLTTYVVKAGSNLVDGLNAPFGARCFLTWALAAFAEGRDMS